MADKKEVNILLLGIVAILAIVGLVLLFTSPAATGKLWQPPALPPSMETPAPVGYEPQAGESGFTKFGQRQDMAIISSLEGSNLPRCPNGKVRTRMQGNLPYEAIQGYLCDWFDCPGITGTDDPAATPKLACVKI